MYFIHLRNKYSINIQYNNDNNWQAPYARVCRWCCLEYTTARCVLLISIIGATKTHNQSSVNVSYEPSMTHFYKAEADSAFAIISILIFDRYSPVFKMQFLIISHKYCNLFFYSLREILYFMFFILQTSFNELVLIFVLKLQLPSSKLPGYPQGVPNLLV